MRTGSSPLILAALVAALAVPCRGGEAWPVNTPAPAPPPGPLKGQKAGAGAWPTDPPTPPVYDGITSWWNQCKDVVEMHRRRVSTWPDGFVVQDRESVRAPFRTMADNGWKLQNTLPNDLFEPDTQQLTYAGRLKLRWLLTQIPPHRRQVYVLEGETLEATSARVASVHRTLQDIDPAQACLVATTRIAPPSAPASYMEHVDKTYQSSMPVPRLPGGMSSGPVQVSNPQARGQDEQSGQQAQ